VKRPKQSLLVPGIYKLVNWLTNPDRQTIFYEWNEQNEYFRKNLELYLRGSWNKIKIKYDEENIYIFKLF